MEVHIVINGEEVVVTTIQQLNDLLGQTYITTAGTLVVSRPDLH